MLYRKLNPINFHIRGFVLTAFTFNKRALNKLYFVNETKLLHSIFTSSGKQKYNTYSVPGIVLFVCKIKKDLKKMLPSNNSIHKRKKMHNIGNYAIKIIKALHLTCYVMVLCSKTPNWGAPANFVKFKKRIPVCKCKKGPCNYSLEFPFSPSSLKRPLRELWWPHNGMYFTCRHLTDKGHLVNMAESRRTP